MKNLTTLRSQWTHDQMPGFQSGKAGNYLARHPRFSGWLHKILITFILLSIATTISWATDVRGPISTDRTWTEANSPYVMIGSVLVKAGATLTIESGVTVKVGDGFALTVQGGLVAIEQRLNPSFLQQKQANGAISNLRILLLTLNSTTTITTSTAQSCSIVRSNMQAVAAMAQSGAIKHRLT